jgi:hypothetical protein
MQNPKHLLKRLHSARRQMQRCAKLVVGEAHKDLSAQVNDTLEIIIRTLYLFHEQCPPQDSVVLELLRTAQDLEFDIYDALLPSGWIRADEVQRQVEE